MRSRTLSLAFVCALIAAASLAIPQPAKAVWPNPFVDGQKPVFQLTMPRSAKIKIEVFDLIGRHVQTLFEGEHAEGNYDIVWDGMDDTQTNVPPGVYICVLFSEGVAVKSVKVIKVRFQ
jgi:hypothetical protein